MHAIGSRVKIDGDIEGVVLAFAVRGSTITYDVAWWSDGKRETEWFQDFEVRAIEGEPRTVVGFRA